MSTFEASERTSYGCGETARANKPEDGASGGAAVEVFGRAGGDCDTGRFLALCTPSFCWWPMADDVARGGV
eukprot:754637-Prymnesium_polylepis.1